MEQKYIVGDVVMYHNKIMVVKEPRDESHFDLSCPKEGLVYCFVVVEDIKPVVLNPEILEKNRWDFTGYNMDFNGNLLNICSKRDILPCLYYYCATKSFSVFIRRKIVLPNMKYIHELQHLLFGLGLNSEMET